VCIDPGYGGIQSGAKQSYWYNGEELCLENRPKTKEVTLEKYIDYSREYWEKYDRDSIDDDVLDESYIFGD